jgi:DNA damage-binding protein 1
MGAISGYIGLLLQLPLTLYQLLLSLQTALAEHVPSVGKIDHSAWRSFESTVRSNVSRGFIDGDLIETYLDLPKTVQSELIKNLHVKFFFNFIYLVKASFFLGRKQSSIEHNC